MIKNYFWISCVVFCLAIAENILELIRNGKVDTINYVISAPWLIWIPVSIAAFIYFIIKNQAVRVILYPLVFVIFAAFDTVSGIVYMYATRRGKGVHDFVTPVWAILMEFAFNIGFLLGAAFLADSLKSRKIESATGSDRHAQSEKETT